MSAPAAAIIPSSRSPCRSRRRPAAACWCARRRGGGRARRRWRTASTELCRRAEASSVHVTFLPEPEWELSARTASCMRTDQQFHWENAGYATFDAFLAALSSRKRKTIRRERARCARARHQHSLAHRQGSDRRACGTPSSSSTWTPARANGAGPTSPASSTRWSARACATSIVLVMAKRDGRWIAGAINFIGSRHAVRPPLGRHRAASVPAFRGLLLSGDRIRHRPQARAGRGRRAGQHKIARGYLPSHHLFGALHRRPGAAAGGRRLSSSASAPMWKPRRSRSLPTRRRSARIWSSRNRTDLNRRREASMPRL